jgi:TRAP-type C4-dicarboxylate transport system permease small subunit
MMRGSFFGERRIALRPTACAADGGPMNALRIVAVALVVLGVLALVYGSFSYTKETHEAQIGPLQLTIKDRQTVNIPVWAGAAAVAAGVVLMLYGSSKG